MDGPGPMVRAPLVGLSRRSIAGILGAIATLPLVLELSVRWLSPQPNIYLHSLQGDHVFNRPRFDDGFTSNPHGPYASVVSPMQTNERGERDDQIHTDARNSDHLRLVLLGSSIGFGWRLDLDDIYIRALERQLPGVETINCSLGAANVAELLNVYRRRCARYEADVVVVEVDLTLTAAGVDALDTDRFGPDYRLIRLLWRERGENIFAHIRFDGDGTPLLDPALLSGPDGAVIHHFYEPKLTGYRQWHLIRAFENRWLTHHDGLGGGAYLGDRLRPEPLPFDETERAEVIIAPTLRLLQILEHDVTERGATLLVLLLPRGARGPAPRPELGLFIERLRETDIVVVDLIGDPSSPASGARYDAPGHRRIAAALAGSLRAVYPERRLDPRAGDQR